ncbi:MAG: hypothetical protein LBQ97_02525 [Fusobacteriaceae bacterium]|nr:hypothetical protein [Fusobacteriaceae bacterium]
MEIDKIFRFGIDKVKLFGFDMKTEKKWKIQSTENEDDYIEKTVINDELFSIVSTYRLKSCGDTYEEIISNHIEFNPNRILSGNNVRNATTADLQEAVDILTEILAKKEVYVDFSDAKIKEIEFNVNLPVDFESYKRVFQLFIFQFREPKFIGRFIKKEKESEYRSDETYFTKINKKSSFLIYDKSKESDYPKEVTRMEYQFSYDTYRYNVNLYGLTNSLEDLLRHPEIPEKLFVDRAKKDFLQKAFQFLEENIKPILEREYLNFKKNNRFYKLNGRPQRRNVYKYLNQYNIFDYSFLIDLVQKHDAPHMQREKERIIRKYGHLNNVEKLNRVMNFLLPIATT